MSQGRAGYYLARIVGWILPFIPPRLGYPLAELLGGLLYFLLPRPRSAVLSNLRRVLGTATPEARLRALARQVFRNAVKNYYELFRHRWTSEEKLLSVARVEGLEHIAQALEKGKGLIIVSIHMGSPEAFMQIAPLWGYPITAVVEPLNPPALLDYMLRLRQRHGIKLIPADGPLFAIFRALKKNEVISLAMDRDVTESGPVVEFFGAPARLADGSVQLALRTGAALCLGYGVRNPDNTFYVVFDPPLELEVTGERRKDIQVNMQKLVARMEKIIRQHPEQWLMFQPMWSNDG